MQSTPGAPRPNFAPKRKARDPFWDSRTCAAVSALILFLNVLPASAARAFGRFVGRCLWKFNRRHRARVLRHMDLAFRNEKTQEEKERICIRFFEHMGLAAIEFARLGQLTKENLEQTVDLTEAKKFDELLAKGKGLLCVPAHHGNWELSGYAVALKGYPIKSVARPLDNPLINDLVMNLRERSGNEIIQKWKALWKLKKLLDHGNIVTMSIDQNGGVAGLFVPMFGVPASTVTSPADLHLATGSPIIVATTNRCADGVRHVLRVWDIIEHKPGDDYAADVRAIITRINAAVERAVREYPEQWLWIHQRWKTRPPGEVLGADGLPPKCTT